MLRTIITAAALTAGLTSIASAQNFSLNPAYGTLNLSAGFNNDPRAVNLQSGGSIPASNVSNSCRGYIADAPDVRVNYASGSLPLIFSVASGVDTTLVINAPDGRWYCDDDSGNGVNPSIRFGSPSSGQYDVWVGTYASATLQNATLYVSELSSQ
ncbi:peptidase S1 [Maricaulaceae bacterium MS644]